MPVVGYLERIALPALGVNGITAKVDTGAQTSTLDATDMIIDDNTICFRLVTTDKGRRSAPVTLPLLEWRWIRDSGGHPTYRPIVRTEVVLGDGRWVEEFSLVDRTG